MKLKFNHLNARLLMLLVVMLVGTAAYGQRTVTGVVTDAESGEALIGANILIVGTASGTITGIDGDFTLEVPEGATQIEVSYTGYESQIIELGNETNFTITLGAGKLLDEVVVIGYGTTTKKDKTGAVASVDTENFNRGAVTAPDQLIVGKVAGVQITANNGAPGSNSKIRIRGGTSIRAGNEPLFVIDGVPIDNSGFNPGGFSEGKNPLNTINPSDIESFTVLKDASATAIYGSRAANGVIIITTKSGKAGDRNRISYDGYVTVAQAIETPNVLSTSEFRSVVEEVAPDEVAGLGEADTDWFDQILQNGIGHNHSLSFTGGGATTGYRISLGYQNLDGIIKTSNTERLSANLSLNSSFLDDHLKVTTNLKVAFTRDQFNDGGAIGSASSFDPTRPVLDPESPFGGYWEWDNPLGTKNPVATLELTDDLGRAFRSIGNVKFDYSFHSFEDLTFSLNLGYDINNGLRERYLPSFLRSRDGNGGNLRFENYSVVSPLLEAFLKYEKDLPNANSRIDVLAGYSYQSWFKDFYAQEANQIDSDFLGLNGVGGTDDIKSIITRLENNLISYFGRVNYYLLDKYQVTATIRRDGSSRFGPSNRWGIFPSAAVAWRLIDEPFMSGAKSVLSDLKLRASWGITGNQEIPDYLHLSTYTISDFKTRYLFGDQFVTTLRSDGADPNVKWEETTSYNVGLDYGFSNGRFAGSIEWYLKQTNDLLFEVGVPAGVIPINRVTSNIGSVENIGYELTLDAVVLDKEDFDWNLSANFSQNINEIITLDRADDPDFIGYPEGGISGGVGNNIRILRVGQAVNTFFVFEHLLGPDGKPLVDGVDHNEDGAINLADIYADTNDDGMVNDEDKRPFLNGNPDFLFGLTSNFYAYNFDFSFTFRGALGNYVYNNNASNTGNYAQVVSGIVLQNMDASVLETQFQEEQLFSDYYIENGSFGRLDNITIGYTINNIFENNGGNLRIYATGQNLILITNYTGLDPEVFGGIDNNIYPRARTFLFGVNVNF